MTAQVTRSFVQPSRKNSPIARTGDYARIFVSEKRRQSQSRARWFRRDGSERGGEAELDRAVPARSKRYGFTGSADRAVKRTHQLSHHSPQVPCKRPCVAPRAHHDGEPPPAIAGILESS